MYNTRINDEPKAVNKEENKEKRLRIKTKQNSNDKTTEIEKIKTVI